MRRILIKRLLCLVGVYWWGSIANRAMIGEFSRAVSAMAGYYRDHYRAALEDDTALAIAPTSFIVTSLRGRQQ